MGKQGKERSENIQDEEEEKYWTYFPLFTEDYQLIYFNNLHAKLLTVEAIRVQQISVILHAESTTVICIVLPGCEV